MLFPYCTLQPRYIHSTPFRTPRPADHPPRFSEFKLARCLLSTSMDSHAHDYHRRRPAYITAPPERSETAAREVEPKSIAEAVVDKLVKLLHSDIGKAFVTGTLMLVGSHTKFSLATALISGICQAILIFEYTGVMKLRRSTAKILKTVALLVMLVRMALQQDFLGRLANFTALCCALSWS